MLARLKASTVKSHLLAGRWCTLCLEVSFQVNLYLKTMIQFESQQGSYGHSGHETEVKSTRQRPPA